MQYREKQALHLRKVSSIFCFVVLLLGTGVKAKPAEYDLRVLRKQKAAVQIDTLQVYESKTGHVVWAHPYPILGTYPDNGTFFWSRNRRAVAFVIDTDGRKQSPSDYEGYKIIVWRAGGKIHVISHQPVTAHDYVEDMVWSSDGKSLLIWVGGSGEDMGDMGHLFCFNVVSQKIYSLGDTIGKPSWVGSQTAKFWQVEYLDKDEGGPRMVRARKRSFWHLPKIRRRSQPAT